MSHAGSPSLPTASKPRRSKRLPPKGEPPTPNRRCVPRRLYTPPRPHETSSSDCTRPKTPAPPHACHHANRNRLRDACAPASHLKRRGVCKGRAAQRTAASQLPKHTHQRQPIPRSPTRPSPPHPVRRLRRPVPPSRNLFTPLSASPFSPSGLLFPHLAASSPPQSDRSPM